MSKIVLITGATAGIGEACAIKFAAEGWNLILTGRRKERLVQLEKKLQEEYGVKVLTLNFDVRDLKEVQKNIQSIRSPWTNIDVLINNAGLAIGIESFEEGQYKDWDLMIDTNIKGLLYVSREVAPLMIANGKGHIINLASLAGHEVYPNGHVYCATKHAVIALSKGMRVDMVKDNIKVSTISPGAVETEFSYVRYKGDEEMVKSKYEGYEPLTAKDIAESAYFIANQPAHVNIEEIWIQPTAQANPYIIERKD
ncbi:MAG: SDR family NAD(P)-dependent oxidoreductase [Chitinophagales bacterium]